MLVLGGLGALWYFNQDDDDDAAATTATATTARTVRVPDVVGTTSSEATATLRTEGLEANVVSVPSDAPAGQVIAQDPAAGDEVEEGTTVRLNVARPSADTTPAATGPATTPTEPPATTTEPPATTTEPAATTTEPPATTAAPEPAVVPSVVGQELADVAATFADEGLKVAVRYVPSREAGGQVVAQAQPPGTELREGDTVQLNVSTGAEPAESAAVPRAVGQRLDEGRETLERAGFEVLALTVGDDEIRNETRSCRSRRGAAPRSREVRSCSSTSSAGCAWQRPWHGVEWRGWRRRSRRAEHVAGRRQACSRCSRSRSVSRSSPPAAGPTTTTRQPARRPSRRRRLGRVPTTVPDIGETDLPDAAQQLADEGLRVAVEYVPSNEPRGRVIGQPQAPGTSPAGRHRHAERLDRPEPARGGHGARRDPADEADGRAALERVGFDVLTIDVPAVGEDVVVAHSPPAAARVPRGSLVILYAGG